MTHTGAIGYLVIVIWPFTFKNDKQISAGSQTNLIISSSWTISECGGRLHEQGLPIMMNNKNKVYQLEGGHLHDENGGKASAWMTASYVSALAAFTQWQKHTDCQAFESISSSKHYSFPKSCQWWWSQKRCEDTFDITLSSLILNECTFKPTMCTPEGHNISITMISQMWMLNSRRRSAARRDALVFIP